VVNFVPVCALISYKSDPVVTKFHPAVCGFVCVYVRACVPNSRYGKWIDVVEIFFRHSVLRAIFVVN